MGPVLDHVDIRVSDRDASQRFYETVLTVLGRTEHVDDDEYIDWGDFSIVSDGQPVARHLHIAFYAPSHELVDAFHRAGVEAGYTDEARPARGRSTARTTTARSCATRTATASKRCTRARSARPARSTICGSAPVTSRPIRRFYLATGQEIGVDEADHVQIVTGNASISYVLGEPATEHVHIAFGVDTNEAVDAFHRAAIDAGYTDNGAPGERAAYHPGYYGAFVLDPDGHNIEAVNHNRIGAS